MPITFDPAKTDDDGEVRELTADDFASFKPFSSLQGSHQEKLLSLRKRGPQKAPRKVQISIRLSSDVAEGLRAIGEGWQVRADEALRSWLTASGQARRARRG